MEFATDETRTLSEVTTHLEGLAIGSEHVDGETNVFNISFSKRDAADAETDSDVDASYDDEGDAASHVSCETCKVLSARPCDGSFVDMAVRFWPASDEKRAGTRRLLFSLGVTTPKEDNNLILNDADGDLFYQSLRHFSEGFGKLREDNASIETRRGKLDELAKDLLQVEDSIRSDESNIATQQEGPESEGDVDSDSIDSKYERWNQLVGERQMRLAFEVVDQWRTIKSIDEQLIPSLILRHMHRASEPDALDKATSISWTLEPEHIPATTTYIPGSDGRESSVRLECPRLEGGEVTCQLSDIQDLAGEWLDGSARDLRNIADKVISQEAERGQKLEVDIAIDVASTRDILSGHAIPGERERVQLWNPESPTRSVSAADASTWSNQCSS
jgi:hypothetical protein